MACLWNPKYALLEHKYGRNPWKMSKIGQNSIKNCRFLPISCHEWQGIGPKQVFYSFLVPEMIWWKSHENRMLGSAKSKLPSLVWPAVWKVTAPLRWKNSEWIQLGRKPHNWSHPDISIDIDINKSMVINMASLLWYPIINLVWITWVCALGFSSSIAS